MTQRIHRAVAAAAVTAAGLAFTALPANAAPQNLRCSISMHTDVTYDSNTGIATYNVTSGGGSCLGDLKGTREVTILSGTGTSTGFGPGSGCPTPTTADFTLTLVAALTSTATGATTTVTEVLSAPGLDDIPGTDTVQVTNQATSNSSTGAFSYKIAHNCATGNGSTQFDGNFPL
ncbi:MAG: hypothetical protein ACJ735_08535 [Actinomycetes bacterium]